jgi:hypothetical protein
LKRRRIRVKGTLVCSRFFHHLLPFFPARIALAFLSLDPADFHALIEQELVVVPDYALEWRVFFRLPFFGDGKRFGVTITYLMETQPLGTAGPIALIPFVSTLLVMNGDVLTSLNYLNLIDYHKKNKAKMTIGMSTQSYQNPLAHNETTIISYNLYVKKTVFNRVEFMLFKEMVLDSDVIGSDHINGSYRDVHLRVTVR